MTDTLLIASLKLQKFAILVCCYIFALGAALPHQTSRLVVAQPAHPHEYILKSDFKISATPVTREYNFVITETTAALDGFSKPVLAINNQIPGPLIEANEGDCLEIKVTNHMTVGVTLHWHGLYQNGTNWEDGVTGVTQCPIPPHGGHYIYKFKLTGQFGTFWYHSHHQNLMADGISGPLIIHSLSDPLKRSVDFDEDVVLMLADWYHNTSTSIIADMLSETGYFGTPAAPSPHSAIINGVGQWNCSFATATQQCQQVTSPPRFTFKAGERIRFRLINAGVHAMFFYSVDEHTLNVTEADGTGIYGPSDLHRLRFHNGQRYSVIVQTKKKDAGKSFYMRARMDPDCWSWVFNDVQLTALGIIALAGDDSYVIGASSSETAPQTVDWPDEFTSECLDINTNSMVPIIQRSVPRQVSGSGAFQNAFGFEIIATGGIITRAEAAASAANNSSLRQDALKNGTFNSTDRAGPLPAASRGTGELLDKREIKLGQPNLPLKHTSYWESITRIAGPPPTPAGTIGKFFVNNKSWRTSPYQPVLHDLLPSGSRARISPTIANVVYPTVGWYDLYLVNLDPVASHPYHLHALDMHLVAIGQGLPTQETIANLTYKTENPLRRDTIVIGGGSFAVVRINADIPGAWLMHCHIGWHLEGGFAGIVVVQPEVVKTFKIPQANLNLCPSRKPPLDAIGPRGTNIIRKTLKVMKTWDIL